MKSLRCSAVFGTFCRWIYIFYCHLKPRLMYLNNSLSISTLRYFKKLYQIWTLGPWLHEQQLSKLRVLNSWEHHDSQQGPDSSHSLCRAGEGIRYSDVLGLPHEHKAIGCIWQTHGLHVQCMSSWVQLQDCWLNPSNKWLHDHPWEPYAGAEVSGVITRIRLCKGPMLTVLNTTSRWGLLDRLSDLRSTCKSSPVSAGVSSASTAARLARLDPLTKMWANILSFNDQDHYLGYSHLTSLLGSYFKVSCYP